MFVFGCSPLPLDRIAGCNSSNACLETSRHVAAILRPSVEIIAPRGPAPHPRVINQTSVLPEVESVKSANSVRLRASKDGSRVRALSLFRALAAPSSKVRSCCSCYVVVAVVLLTLVASLRMILWLPRDEVKFVEVAKTRVDANNSCCLSAKSTLVLLAMKPMWALCSLFANLIID